MHDVVLAAGRTPVRIRARGFGWLRAGDVRRFVWRSFDDVLLVQSAPSIEVRFGSARVTLKPAVIDSPVQFDAHATVEPVSFALPAPPQPRFHVAVRLPREELT